MINPYQNNCDFYRSLKKKQRECNSHWLDAFLSTLALARTAEEAFWAAVVVVALIARAGDVSALGAPERARRKVKACILMKKIHYLTLQIYELKQVGE